MARPSKKKVQLVKECEHLNQMIEKGFPFETQTGERILRFEVQNEKLTPILAPAA